MDFILTHPAWYLFAIMAVASILSWIVAILIFDWGRFARGKRFQVVYSGAIMGLICFALIIFILRAGANLYLPPASDMLTAAKFSFGIDGAVLLIAISALLLQDKPKTK